MDALSGIAPQPPPAIIEEDADAGDDDAGVDQAPTSSVKEAEKRLNSALGIMDDQQASGNTANSTGGGTSGGGGSTAASSKKGRAGRTAQGTGASAAGKKTASGSGAGGSGLNAGAGAAGKRGAAGKGATGASSGGAGGASLTNAGAGRKGVKKGATQQTLASNADANARASVITDIIAETGEEGDAFAGQQAGHDEKKDGTKKQEEQDLLIEEEDDDQEWESDLDVEEIINRKRTQDPYIQACTTLGIVPVSFIIEHLGQQEIIMPHHGLGVRGAKALSKVLEGNTTLVRLDLTNNFVEGGGAYIGQSLKFNRVLTYLNLSDNRLGPDSAKNIADMISENNTIQTLILKGNSFGDREAVLIAEGLRQNSTIEVFDLSHNDIGDVGSIALGAVLSSNETLRDVFIGWNQIRSRGMSAIFNGAKDNTSITRLDIQYNGIGENGNAVAQFLNRNTTILSINMAFTRIDDAAMAGICKALETNHSLQGLDVSGNPISDATVQILLKSVSGSKIKQLLIQNIRTSKDTQKRIEEIKRERSGALAIID